MVSPATSVTKVSLSPFISYQPYFGQEPRSIESLSIQTVRVGLAIKIGKGHKVAVKAPEPIVVVSKAPEHDFIFTARGPKTMPLNTQVSETLPLLNAVFFDDASVEIPNRYVLLTADQASGFKESQLQRQQSSGIAGRSAGQLNTYHNVLNILGDRMRSNPNTTITLNGASISGPKEGKAFATSIKNYLVTVFAIDGSRILISGSFKPHPPSEKQGGTTSLDLLGVENRRVDIESNSPELLMEIGGEMMKPVQMSSTQINPLDTMVVFHVDSAKQLLSSWSVDVTDQTGTIKHYGPFKNNQESVSGTTILGNSPGGDYKLTMLGETNDGSIVKRETSIHLLQPDKSVVKGLRYSIVFDFDKATTIATYKRFLADVVSPLITDGATVTIHGHTDIIGEDSYNQKLSDSRAQQAQQIIEGSLTKMGRTNVKFATTGFGGDVNHSPFDNKLPEERFYNRTVIIDIIPANN